MIQIVFLNTRTRCVIERTQMRGPLDRVKAWAIGYARSLGADASFALSEVTP